MNAQDIHVSLQIDRLRRDSEAAWARFDYATSADLLRRAHKLSPQDPRRLLDLGFHHGLRYDYLQATECFEKAIRLAGGQTAAFAAAGWHCLNFSQPALARGYFERALEKAPGTVEILAPLAGICERLGELDDAEEFAARAAKLAPSHKPARLVQAMVWRRRHRLTEAETILRAVADTPDRDAWASAQIWYELGHNLDRQARYDEAMAAFLNAKKILHPLTAKQEVRQLVCQRQWRAEAGAVTTAMLQRFHAAGSRLQPARPIAFLAGHPRSGTTLLEQILDAHDKTVSLEETKIFDSDLYGPLAAGKTAGRLDWLEQIPLGQLARLRKNYFAKAELFLGQAIGNRMLIDKNPLLTIRFPVIARLFPEARCLVALRDPRDVCLSCFMQALPPGTVNLSYLDLGHTVDAYAAVMDCWLTIRDKMAAPWLEVRYEKVIAGLETEARRVLDFLELPWNGRVLAFNEHSRRKIIRSPTYTDACKPVYTTSQNRWHHYQKYLEPHLARLEPALKALGYA